MSKFIKYDTTLTNVTSFSANYDNRSLSARPEFTGNQYNVTLTNGFSATHILQGYSFESITDVMLSCTDNSPLFSNVSGLTSVSAFNYDTVSGLSATYPEVSGYVISTSVLSPSGTYALNSYNTMSVTFPMLTATGTVDVIAINPAGYGIFSTDIGTTGITIN
jgi:hypothetical protein|tara:strand:- start:1988 stop:2476 length:489 start_codon:yes stop_codon:yes gene_type:complete